MTSYIEAPAIVTTIAQELIHDYHEHLVEARIGFIMRSDTARSQGKDVWAKMSTVPAKVQAFLELDYICEISDIIWQSLPQSRRYALIDHELCHCAINDKGAWGIKAHDFEEFGEIILRHGYWNHELLKAKGAFEKASQLSLPSVTIESRGRVVNVSPETMAQLAGE